MVKQKERSNPRFAFLFGGPHQQYYLNKLAAEKALLHAESSVDSALPRSPAITLPAESRLPSEHFASVGIGHSDAPIYPPPQAPLQRQSRFDQGGFPSNTRQHQQLSLIGQYNPSPDSNAPNSHVQLQYGGDVSGQWTQADYNYENSHSYREALSSTGNHESTERNNTGVYDQNPSQHYSQRYDHSDRQRWGDPQLYMQHPPWNNNTPLPHGYPVLPPHAGAFPPRHAGPPPFHGGFPPPIFQQPPPVPPSAGLRPPGPEPPFVRPGYAGSMPPVSAGDFNTTPASASAPPPTRTRWSAAPPPVTRKPSTDNSRTKQSHGFPAVPAGPPRPWWELPAGIFVDIVPKSAIDYIPLEPEQIVMPKPEPITPDLLSALEQFYDPPEPDRPRNAEGWEKLGLFEHLKMKEIYKKKRADVQELAHQDELISKARQAAKELASRAALSLKSSSVSS